ncbi:unnamed protein product [Pleuronectes platessa]|uniref:Uncharacterized protein n=1 Tax=Pleuronectes platessa TaxID=8262 RepID=A0A9N7Y7J3_PLEPL|nr:unnamed protein product [Pleuronectes platessa]
MARHVSLQTNRQRICMALRREPPLGTQQIDTVMHCSLQRYRCFYSNGSCIQGLVKPPPVNPQETVRLLELTHSWRLCERVEAGRGEGGSKQTDMSHQSLRRPRGMRGCRVCPTGTCRSSVLGAVIFLSTTNLMTEPRGLITPPPPTSFPSPAPRSSLSPLSYPASSPWPGAQSFILKWRRPALHQPGPSACSLLHCLASEKDYYFNSIYWTLASNNTSYERQTARLNRETARQAEIKSNPAPIIWLHARRSGLANLIPGLSHQKPSATQEKCQKRERERRGVGKWTRSGLVVAAAEEEVVVVPAHMHSKAGRDTYSTGGRGEDKEGIETQTEAWRLRDRLAGRKSLLCGCGCGSGGGSGSSLWQHRPRHLDPVC